MASYIATSCAQNEEPCFGKIKRVLIAGNAVIAGVITDLVSLIAAVLILGFKDRTLDDTDQKAQINQEHYWKGNTSMEEYNRYTEMKLLDKLRTIE